MTRALLRGGPLACIGVAGVLAAAGCLSSRVAAPGPSASGPAAQFVFTSAATGRLAIAASTCAAGDRQQFLGADFTDDTLGYVVRLVVDPLEGPAVRVFARDAPFDKTVVFRRADCRVLHFSLDSTGWRINRVEDYRVSLDVDCASAGGESLQGRATAEHCH